MADEITTEAEAGPETVNTPSNDAAAASAGAGAPSAAQPPAPAAPQGPDWNSLGVPFDQAQQRLSYFQELEQRYRTDPVFAQQYDKLYGGQQQPQAHPYDWMTADEKRLEALRQQGEQHPDFPRLQAEFTNFFQNPIGQLSQMINHPKVMESIYSAMAPQIQDMAQRMIQQAMQPINQHFQQQGQQAFEAKYGKAWMALPEQVRNKVMSSPAWKNDRFSAIQNAVEFYQAIPKPAAEGEQPPAQPPTSGAKKPEPAKPQNGSPKPAKGNRWNDNDEKTARELMKSMG